MSRPIDEKIAKLTLDNSDLKTKALESAQIFATLNADIANSADFSVMASNVEQIANKFSTTGLMFQEVISRMTSASINGLTNLVNNSLGLIMEKGSKRALNIEQAKFMFEGLGMDIEETMKSANDAVSGTAFGLDEAAIVASSFGATGMRAGEDMTNALRGIAGVAAMAGSSFSDVGNIFTKVAGQGRLMGSDLLRLSSRGINAAATLAKHLGTTEENVREMVTKGKISFELFATAMNDAFGEHATKANETYTGSLANMQSALGRIGAILYTNKYENRKNLFNAIRPQIDAFKDAITPALEAWNEFSTIRNDNLISMIDGISWDNFMWNDGPEAIANGLTNIFDSILNFTGAIKSAWSKVFSGNQNGSILLKLAKGFEALTESIKFTGVPLELFENAMGITFTVLSWVIDGVKLLIKGLGLLIPSFEIGTDKIQMATGGISDMVYAFDDWLRTSPKVQKTLEAIGDGLETMSDYLVIGAKKTWEGMQWVANAIYDAYIIAEPHIIEFAKMVQTWIIDKWADWQPKLQEFGEEMKKWADIIWDVAKDLSGKAAPLLSEFWDKISEFAGEVNWKQVAILAAVGFALWHLAQAWWDLEARMRVFKADREDSLFGAINRGVIALIKTAKAVTIIGIAMALGALTASVWAFSQLDTQELVNGMAGVGLALFFLSSSFDTIARSSENMKAFSAITTIWTMITAMIAMTGIMYIMSKFSWDELAKGLVGLSVSLFALSTSIRVMSGSKLGPTTLQILALSVALLILTEPLRIMGDMDWESLAKGLLGIGIALGVLAAFTIVSAGGWANVGTAVAIGVIAAALIALTIPIMVFNSMDLGMLAKGLGVMAVALGIVGLALWAMPVYSGASAAALIGVSAALLLLTVPLKILGQMDLKHIGVGLLAIAGVFGIFVVAVYAIGMHGAAILTAVASALGALGLASIGGALMIGVLILAFTGLAKASGPAIDASVDAFERMLKGLQRIMPEIVDTVIIGIESLIDGLVGIIGAVAEIGARIMIAMLTTMEKHLPKITDLAARVLVAFIYGIAEHTPALVMAAVVLAITFIQGLAIAISENSELFIKAVTDLIGALSILIAEGLGAILETFFWWIPGAEKAGRMLSGGVVDGLRDRFNLKAAEETGDAYADVYTGRLTTEEALGRGRGAGGNLSYAVVEGMHENDEEFGTTGEEGVMDYITSLMDGEEGAKEGGGFLSGGAYEGLMGEGLDFELPAMDQLGDYSEVFEQFDGTEMGYGVGGTTHGGMNQFFQEYPLEGLADDELDAYLAQFKEHNEEVRTEAEREAQYSYTGMDEFFEEYPLEGIAEDEIDAYVEKFKEHNEEVRKQGEETAKGSEEGIDSVPLDQAGKRKVEEYNSGITHENPNTRTIGKGTVRETESGIDEVDLSPAGKRKMQEYQNGVTHENPNAKSKGKGTVRSTEQGIDSVSLDQAGRRKAREIGSGITHENPTVRRAGKESAEEGRTGAGRVSYSGTGRMAASGFANGLSWGGDTIWNAAWGVAQKGLSAIRQAFRTESPSRETFEIGQYVSQGLANGIARDEGRSTNSARHMALAAINAVEQTSKDFKAKIFDQLELNPTITPVLDLSNIESQRGMYKDLLGDVNSPVVRQLSELFSQSKNRNLDSTQTASTGDTIVNEYHANLTAYGNMPDSMIRQMAGKFQAEFKRMSDRKEMNRGGVLV